jgi:GR25 family glycosyltransferase involved in LPS biosynthesis
MKYAIISISDDRKDNISKIKELMHEHEFVNSIEFFDGREHDPFPVLQSHGVRTDVYAPDDGRSEPMTKSECGCWISHYRCIEYAKNDGNLLVLEDDAVLDENFTSFLDEVIKDLPDSWDFLSLFSEVGQNFLSHESDIGSKHIHKCISQLSMAQAILYSENGAQKILKIFTRLGTTYNLDSVIYRASRDGLINGYIVRPDTRQHVMHGDFSSIIDPENKRNT